jgi:error-prone DNA polymerase
VDAGRVRLGFNYVAGLGEASIARLVEVRSAGVFSGLVDFCRRTRLPRRLIENLILAGAMDEWGLPRRQLLWQLGQLQYTEEELDLVFPDDGVSLPPLSPAEATELEQTVMGLSTGEHVMAHYRDWLHRRGILGSREVTQCPAEKRVHVAGLLVVHQSPPTARGFHFLALEDSDGLVDIIVRPQIYARYRHFLHSSHLLIIEGIVQRESGVVNVLAQRIALLPMVNSP